MKEDGRKEQKKERKGEKGKKGVRRQRVLLCVYVVVDKIKKKMFLLKPM